MSKKQQLGLIGGESIANYSVAHLVWREIAKAANANSQFEYYPIADAERLSAKLGQVRTGEILGVNIALPWKEHAAAQCDVQTETVAATGYANTIYSKDGKLHADNTDGRGFLRGLDSKVRHALIFGAGGAGTVLAYELIRAGADVVLADVEKAAIKKSERLTKGWRGSAHLQILHTQDVKPRNFDLVVNATPLGRDLPFGHSDASSTQLSPMTDEFANRLSGVVTFAEMNYYPARTKFLAQAEGIKQLTIPGLAMLLNQAILSYQDYSGILLNNGQIGSIRQRLEKELFDNQ